MTNRDELIQDNLSLVPFMYHRYIVKTNIALFLQEDLLSEGFLGLIRAAETYNPSRNVKFSSYASKIILRRMIYFLRREQNKNAAAPNGEKLFSYEKTTSTILDTDDGSITVGDGLYSADLPLDEDLVNKEIIKNTYTVLTPRQKEILSYTAIGYKPIEIAVKLNVSRQYVQAIMVTIRKKCEKVMSTTSEGWIINKKYRSLSVAECNKLIGANNEKNLSLPIEEITTILHTQLGYKCIVKRSGRYATLYLHIDSIIYDYITERQEYLFAREHRGYIRRQYHALTDDEKIKLFQENGYNAKLVLIPRYNKQQNVYTVQKRMFVRKKEVI